MNKGLYKVVFCRLRRMRVAVAEFAVSHVAEPGSGTGARDAARAFPVGDGMYEEQPIRNQITQLTGCVYLEGYTNSEDEYRALMNNGKDRKLTSS